MMKDLCAYLDNYNIPYEKDDKPSYCKRIVVDDIYIVERWNTGSWDIYEVDRHKNLAEFHQIYDVVRVIDRHYGIKMPEHYKSFYNTNTADETYGIEKAEDYLVRLKKQLSEHPLTALDFKTDDDYYDPEYEGPDKETFMEMYEDSCKGWDSIEGFELKLHMFSGSYVPLYYVAFPDPKPIKSKYSSWKDIAEEYRDSELEDLKNQIKYTKRYYESMLSGGEEYE